MSQRWETMKRPNLVVTGIDWGEKPYPKDTQEIVEAGMTEMIGPCTGIWTQTSAAQHLWLIFVHCYLGICCQQLPSTLIFCPRYPAHGVSAACELGRMHSTLD